MQPYFLPYIGAFQMINAVEKYVVYGAVNYQNDGWFHRNRMILKNQGQIFFYVSMIRASIHKTYNEIYVDPSKIWRDKILKTYVFNYSKTQYFSETKELLETILYCDYENIVDFNYNSLQVICDYLGIGEKLHRIPEHEAAVEAYIRQNEEERCESELVEIKTLRIVRICQLLKANTYYNPIGGIDIYKKEVFENFGLHLRFLKTLDIVYRQDSVGFIPNLSIIDVLSNCGRDGTLNHLNAYALI